MATQESTLQTSETVPSARPGTFSRQNLLRLLTGALLLAIVALALPRLGSPAIAAPFETFVTIFLGIFIEAVPFLVAGAVVSGFIEVYVDQAALARLIPRRTIPAALAGAMLGFVFPVCECGVVPVTRRLYHKGLPLPVGAAFLLAAPVINPVVILSTYAAFGWGEILWGRVLFSLLIAFAIGLVFSLARPAQVLLPDQLEAPPDHAPEPQRSPWAALGIGADDFLDMVRYLIAGSMLAAAMQTLVPQSTLLGLGQGPVLSVLVMMALAFVLSICSTVDAFVALSFVNTFTTGSILGFLVFGPMVDIKSAMMFLSVFRRRVVVYLILLPLAMTLVIALFVNLYLGW
jgi:hypothetical protein